MTKASFLLSTMGHWGTEGVDLEGDGPEEPRFLTPDHKGPGR